MEVLRGEVAAEFEVLGFLGRRDEKALMYLARERATTDLVVLSMEADDDGSGEASFALSIRRQLDESVPDVESFCPKCRATLRPWARFCTQCGADISGVSASGGSREVRRMLLDAVRAQAGDEFEVLGEMGREDGGGLFYFARDLSNGRLVGLRLTREGDEDYALNVTRVLSPLAVPLATEPQRPARAAERPSLVRRLDEAQSLPRLAPAGVPVNAQATPPRVRIPPMVIAAIVVIALVLAVVLLTG